MVKNNKIHAFSLIELLVVITIIALLLAIIVPSLKKAKEQAQNAICKSNMHQWGLIFQMYTESNNGKFHRGWDNTKGLDYLRRGLWLHALRPYYTDNDDVRTCPSAVRLDDSVADASGSITGGSIFAWGRRTDWVSNAGDPFNYGSYGLNGYVCSAEDISSPDMPNENEYWRRITVSGSFSLSNIPILLDSAYWKSYVESTNPPPPEYDYLHYNPGQVHSNYMACHVINRHSGRINAVFFDLSVDSIGLKSLWNLKWSPVWQPPPVRPTWPNWMIGYPE